MILLILAISTLASLSSIDCQTNGVKPNLMPCYNASAIPGITIADNRPPSSLNIFLEMIRNLEDANPTKSPMELSILIIQRLRQDGIVSTDIPSDSPALPFSPLGYEAYKQTLIIDKFMTNISLELYHGDLDPVDICSFHYMISSTTGLKKRGDEQSTCGRSARYTSRITRDVEHTNNNDVELMNGFSPQSFVKVTDRSQCPTELGVVLTDYGTIKAGQVLNGIATGFAQEKYSECDNRYAATLSGELVESALVQCSKDIDIGAQGGWNSTINPRYYFLQKNDKLTITDAEIRGSLDGLLIALKLQTWKSKFPDIKISQIFDLYYSFNQKGVFDSTFRSCNRNILYTEMTSTETLRTEISNLVKPFDDGFLNPCGTFSAENLQERGNASLDAFNNYLPHMKDLSCPPKDSYIERVATDLLIFIDSSWNYNTIQSVISYILDNIDVNKFGSRYTIFSGFDSVNITSNSTRHLLDFFKQYNSTIHQRLVGGFDYSKVYETMESIVKSKLDNNTYLGGESTIVLLMPRTPPNENEKVLLNQRKEIIKKFLPDLMVLVLGSGSQGDYSSVILNPNKDFISLNDLTNEDNIKTLGRTVIERIKSVPRSVVNPSCSSHFKGSTNTFTLTDYVELNGVNYYKISPNYFHTGGGTRNLRIKELSYGSIDVCVSRDQSKPDNQTSECKTLRSSEFTKDITGYCGGSTISSCSPIYLSIIGNTTQYRCRDFLCRFPENIKYTISLENVGCASGSLRTVGNVIVVFILFALRGLIHNL